MLPKFKRLFEFHVFSRIFFRVFFRIFITSFPVRFVQAACAFFLFILHVANAFRAKFIYQDIFMLLLMECEIFNSNTSDLNALVNFGFRSHL